MSNEHGTRETIGEEYRALLLEGRNPKMWAVYQRGSSERLVTGLIRRGSAALGPGADLKISGS